MQQLIQQLKEPRQGKAKAGITTADAVKLGSFLVAASKVLDQAMLTARLVLQDQS